MGIIPTHLPRSRSGARATATRSLEHPASKKTSTLLTRWIIPAVIIYTVATSRPELFFVAASTMVLMLLSVLCAGRITGVTRAEARLRLPERGTLRHPCGLPDSGRGSRARVR